MPNEDSKLYIERSLYSGNYDFYFLQRNKLLDTISVAQPLTLETHTHAAGVAITKLPTFSIPTEDRAFMQHLIDELWNLGIRPTNVRSGNDVIDAISSHLDDMRTISFHKLGIPNQCKSK